MGPTLKMKRRLNIIIAGALAVFAVYITANLVNISLVDSAYYQNMANEQQLSSISIDANRGTIYDANNKVLAWSATVWMVIIEPTKMRENDADKIDLIVDTLSDILGVDKEKLRAQTQKKNRYEIVKRQVEQPEMDAVLAFADENGITSIYHAEDSKRYYPNGTLAANVLGFTDFDYKGVYGLESSYDKYLSGSPGRVLTAQDARGDEMPYRYKTVNEPVEGSDLVLTIDEVLQHYLEKNLQSAVETHKAKSRGTGIIMNPKTGAILAMATYPSYDPNNPSALFDPEAQAQIAAMKADPAQTEDTINQQIRIFQETQWKNKAIGELYYPGSVFKVVTGSSALEEKLVSPNDTFSITDRITVKGTTFSNWRTSGNGTLNFTQAFVNSNNPVFIQVGLRLGPALFSQYFKAYGLTERTGIDLPGEVSSLYVREEDMGQVELASSSFGQTNKITPIEMITAYAAVINGGYLVTPYVVDKVLDNEGNVIQTHQTAIKRQVISEETSHTMQNLLETVVTTNGGSNAYIKGYHIGGKSGTSEKQDENLAEGRDDLYVSSFVGFAPASDPEIIMLVMVDEPSDGTYYGSAVAAPVVANTFAEALPYLGFQPQYTQEELESMEVNIQQFEGQPVESAQNALSSLHIQVEVIGDGPTVVRQIPERGSTLPRDGTVLLYTTADAETQQATVPDLTSLTAQQVSERLASLGLNVRLSGGAVNHSGAKATQQNIAAGTVVPKGTIVEVWFVVNDETG